MTFYGFLFHDEVTVKMEKELKNNSKQRVDDRLLKLQITLRQHCIEVERHCRDYPVTSECENCVVEKQTIE